MSKSENPVADNPATDQPAANVVAPPAGGTLSTPAGRFVRDSVLRLRDTHHIREGLVARGVPFPMLQAMIDLGVQQKTEEQKTLIGNALESSKASLGVGAIARDVLLRELAELVEMEKDAVLARRVAREQGLNIQALNFLTNMVMQNPGDAGEAAVNALLRYAKDCEIRMDLGEGGTVGGSGSVSAADSEPRSVLPRIERAEHDPGRYRLRHLLGDVAIGVVLSATMLMIVV